MGDVVENGVFGGLQSVGKGGNEAWDRGVLSSIGRGNGDWAEASRGDVFDEETPMTELRLELDSMFGA